MTVLVSIDWRDPYRTRVLQATLKHSYRAVVRSGNGIDAYSIQLVWEKGNIAVGEAMLLVKKQENEIFRPGAKIAVNEGWQVTSIITVLSKPYDNNMIQWKR